MAQMAQIHRAPSFIDACGEMVRHRKPADRRDRWFCLICVSAEILISFSTLRNGNEVRAELEPTSRGPKIAADISSYRSGKRTLRRFRRPPQLRRRCHTVQA